MHDNNETKTQFKKLKLAFNCNVAALWETALCRRSSVYLKKQKCYFFKKKIRSNVCRNVKWFSVRGSRHEEKRILESLMGKTQTAKPVKYKKTANIVRCNRYSPF